MKVIEITNVDFSLRHFLLPLMRGARARGHEVLGACAEGPLLHGVRAEGFRVVRRCRSRGASRRCAHAQALRALVRLFRAERPDLVHAHMPISGVPGPAGRPGRRACRISPIPATGFCSTSKGRRLRRAWGW